MISELTFDEQPGIAGLEPLFVCVAACVSEGQVLSGTGRSVGRSGARLEAAKHLLSEWKPTTVGRPAPALPVWRGKENVPALDEMTALQVLNQLKQKGRIAELVIGNPRIEPGIGYLAAVTCQVAGQQLRAEAAGAAKRPAQPPGLPAWFPPPLPAPTTEHLHALVNDAAVEARDFLRIGVPLERAWDEDTVRLRSRIPHTCIPDIADRPGPRPEPDRHRTLPPDPSLPGPALEAPVERDGVPRRRPPPPRRTAAGRLGLPVPAHRHPATPRSPRHHAARQPDPERTAALHRSAVTRCCARTGRCGRWSTRRSRRNTWNPDMTHPASLTCCVTCPSRSSAGSALTALRPEGRPTAQARRRVRLW